MQLETGQGSSYNIPDVIGRGGGVCVAVHRGVMTMEKERLLWRKKVTMGQTEEGWKEVFYLTMYSTHFIYGYMASDI